ncbi:MAG: DUF11 domain-containing protein, partial [Chloroflexi bacterium]|nr:DUF11 domain-containing protein [Chloroflexota bacterium]
NTLTAQTGLQGYELEGNVTVPANTTLTVEPGMTMRGRANIQLQVQGHLEAIGTPSQSITFTSSSDAPDGWQGLYFYTAGSTGHLRHATVRYGGDILSSNVYVQNVTDGQVIIESSQVSSVSASGIDYGLYATNSNVVISDTLFADNGDSMDDYALYSTNGSAITVTNSTFQNNAGYAARLEPDGPFVMAGGDFSGNGYNRVLLEAAAFAGDNTLHAQTGLESYELESGYLTVPASATLTVESGTTVMGRMNARLWIYGHLEAVGTPVNPITFTSSSGISNGWDGLYFYGATLDTQGTGHLRHVTARYGGDVLHANIYVNGVSDGQVLIESSQVMSATTASATDYGLFTSGSNVVISDTLFADNGDSTNDYALYSTASSVITVTNSAFQNNAGYGLYVDASQANLTCSTVYTNGNDGVRLANSGAFSTLSSAIYDNAGMGINNAAGFTATAVHNWWGDPSGPEHTSNPGGIGDEVSDDVTFAPWLPVATCFADLMVTKSDDPDQVLAQDTLVYTMTVVNDGPGAATVVTLTDTLPDGVVYGTAVCSQGTCNEADGNIICGLGVMGSQTVATVTMWVTPTELGLITNTVTITATTYDAITANNTATETSISLFDYAAPTFTPARSGNALPGASVIYTHTLVNQANAAQSFSLAPVSTAGFTVTVEPATTEVLPFFGGSTIVTVTVQASADAVSDTVDTTTVTANGSISGTVTVTNATDTLFNGAAPSLTPNRSRSALPGESVVYTHTLVNQANAAQSFSLAPISTAGFTVTVEPATTTVLPFFDGSTVITVTVVVPPDATVGVMSTITITATGSLDGSDSVIDQITVQSGYRYIYLPLMLRNS